MQRLFFNSFLISSSIGLIEKTSSKLIHFNLPEKSTTNATLTPNCNLKIIFELQDRK